MRSCKNCEECKRLYIKSRYMIQLCNVFYCAVKDSITNEKCCCEFWKIKDNLDIVTNKKIDNVINDIEYILKHIR